MASKQIDMFYVCGAQFNLPRKTKVSILDGCQSAEDIHFMDIHDFTRLMGMIIARTSTVGNDSSSCPALFH